MSPAERARSKGWVRAQDGAWYQGHALVVAPGRSGFTAIGRRGVEMRGDEKTALEEALRMWRSK